MGSNKRSGSNFERLIVRKLRAHGIFAMRAWGSDGRNLGHHPGVDIVCSGGWRLQAKHRSRIADYVKPACVVDAQVIGDRSGQYVVMTIETFCEVIKRLKAEDIDLELDYQKEVQDTYDGFLEMTR